MKKIRDELIEQLLAFLNNKTITVKNIDDAFEFPSGIGPEIATNILEERNRLIKMRGEGFRSLEELGKVKLIGKARLEGMLLAVERGKLPELSSKSSGAEKLVIRLPKQAQPVVRKVSTTRFSADLIGLQPEPSFCPSWTTPCSCDGMSGGTCCLAGTRCDCSSGISKCVPI